MTGFFQEVWNIFHYYILPVLPFVALVLIEIQLMYNRRENEVMFGTEAFNEKIKAFEFTPKEVRTLEKLVRTSKFENKDAVLNTSILFENAVNEFYRVRNVLSVRDETLEAVASLRRKMDFTGANPLTMVCSTRQFCEGDRIDLEFEDFRVIKRSVIIDRSEKNWSVQAEGLDAIAKNLVGMRVLVRWTRMNDAVYSTKLPIISASSDKILFNHSEQLNKDQLRKWIREVVDFPVEVKLENGETCSGILYDISAGGLLLGLPMNFVPDQKISITFELPTFGEQNVDVKILNNLGLRNPNFPKYFSVSAVFTGTYAWTQEHILQYIFEVNRKTKTKKMGLNGVIS